ncbi:MAG: hypothetical protein ACRC3F_08960, partial [Billgrantia desiderata]
MSLGNRLTLWILCLPLLVLLLVGVSALKLDTEWRKAALRDRIVTAVELQSPEMAQALFDGAQPRLDGMARRLLEIDETRGVGIYTDEGLIELEMGRNRAQVATSPPHTTQLDTGGDLWRLMMPLTVADGGGAATPQAWLELDIDTRALTLDYYRRLATAGLG